MHSHSSRGGRKKARIEIIPLIDIMFFLLACFMLVSLSMTQMRGMKVTLPSATTATPENKSDFHAITIDSLGNLYLEKEAVQLDSLITKAMELVKAKPEARFYIRADEHATHGEVLRVLDRIKQSGIQKVAFETKPQSVPNPTLPPPTPAAPATPAAAGSTLEAGTPAPAPPTAAPAAPGVPAPATVAPATLPPAAASPAPSPAPNP